MKKEYIKSTIELPKELTPVWVSVCGGRPRKMYRVGNIFYYYNKKLNKNGNYSGIGEKVLWRYCGDMAKEEIKPLDINGVKWRKREERGYEDEMGMQMMRGVGYVIYDETHYITWEDLQKLPREI